ncbi:MAG: HEAT repeat domain-containing protein [Vicinamibacterales bacterium]
MPFSSSSPAGRFLIAVALVSSSSAAAAQSQPPRPPAVNAAPGVGKIATASLAQGWSALRDGRTAEAVRIGTALLKAPWSSHDAMGLCIAAALQQGGANAGLDIYERWVASHAEDPYLLRVVAASALGELAVSTEPRLRVAALAALAAEGDGAARQALADATTAEGRQESDEALARLGDAAAIARLQAYVASGGARDKSQAIRALAAAGSGNAASIAAALNDPAPPSRIGAANALAELGATAQIPALRDHLNDSEPAVRFMVSAALARLGDPQSTVTLDSLATHPIGDMRLFAVAAQADRNADGAWIGIVEPLLQDPDPLLRVRAAELLIRRAGDPASGKAALLAALSDANPAVRSEAAALLPELVDRGGPDLALFRRLLRDPLPETRIAAARALLRTTREKAR